LLLIGAIIALVGAMARWATNKVNRHTEKVIILFLIAVVYQILARMGLVPKIGIKSIKV